MIGIVIIKLKVNNRKQHMKVSKLNANTINILKFKMYSPLFGKEGVYLNY